jgi:hypothetical protein
VRTPLLLIAAALLAACSEDSPPTQAAATPPPAPPPAEQAAAPEQGDVAAVEVEEPAADPNATDPCDLKGYDMSKMTVDQHEQLVKLCNESKQ